MAFPREIFISEAKKQEHSLEYIEECLAYIDKLESNRMPVLFSLPHLASEIGLPSDRINKLLEWKHRNYIYFLLKKKDPKKKPREIMAPREELKFIQRWINYNILQNYHFGSEVQGFAPGTSTFKNALIHKNSKYLLKIDLLKFFDTITDKRILQIFIQLGYDYGIATSLTNLCTAKHRNLYWNSFNAEENKILHKLVSKRPPVLPQGAPTSPLLANLSAENLDKKILSLKGFKKFNYSRYADDLCFSADSLFDIPPLALIREIITEEGFYINEKKIKLFKAGMKQYVTGLSTTHKIGIQKSKRKEIFKHLYYAHKYGPTSHLKKLGEKGVVKSNFKGWLLGNISYHYSIDKVIGKKMFDLYNKINWDIS